MYDLSVDPEPLLSLNAEDIKLRIFTANADLPEGVSRIPLKTVHINRCPVLAPMTVLRDADAARLAVDLEVCYRHLAVIKSAPSIEQKLAEVFSVTELRTKITDPDLAIYSGGFFGPQDKQAMHKIHATAPEKLASLNLAFKDKRLPEMLFRYRARNYPATLSAEEQQRWQEYCVQYLTDATVGRLSFDSYFAILKTLDTSTNTALIAQLQSYAMEKKRMLGISN